MANISTIRLAAVSVLEPLRGPETYQLRDVLSYPPMQFAPLPLGYFGQARAAVTMDNAKEIWHWSIPFTVLIAPLGRYAEEMAAIEPFMDDVQALIRVNLSLNTTVNMMKLTRIEEGVLTPQPQGMEYVGFTMYYDVIDKRNVTYQHH